MVTVTDDCGVRTDISGMKPRTYVGPPYAPGDSIPAGLKMILALIDGKHWPLQVAGDTGAGVGADDWGGVNITECDTVTPIDDGPIPDGPFPATPPVYPGVGITAYGCQLNCTYVISGSLGSSVIVGKIDGQWHILRVLGSSSTTPLFGPSNECRCCGNSLKDVKLRAKIVSVTPDGCGSYRACDEFLLDPVSTALGNNPMGLTLSCQSTEGSLLEDIEDWEAFAFGNQATIISITCCNPYETCTCELMIGSGVETCVCCGGSGSGSGSGSGADCRFEAVIEFTHEGCAYRVLIWAPPIIDPNDDPCTEFADEVIDEVIAEANGLPTLEAGTRVIIAKIPGGLAGRAALGGTDPVEWFIIRACIDSDCAFPCDVPPPQGPPCCGLLCSEMPNGLSATVEILETDCPCDTPASFAVSLIKEGIANRCEDAANTRWFAHDLTDVSPPEIGTCSSTLPDPPFYPTRIAIVNMLLTCGSSAADSTCGDGGSGSGSGSGSGALGPLMSLVVYYRDGANGDGAIATALATQNRRVSCCDPLYLEYEITIPICYVAGAGSVIANTRIRITISE